ncbi:MAG: M20/M25/M40 family metallo-hydrolase [Thalassotalea sp.]|nr:M20/M25/M40 family metallo-hydrolase [Thalassotalea sp.]
MIKTVLALLCFLTLVSCNSTNFSKENKKPLLINIESKQLLAHFKLLSSDTLQVRKVSTEGNLKAQQYIIQQLSKFSVLPFKAKFTHPFNINSTFTTKTGNNVIGLIRGSEKKSGYIVLTAHFDHLGMKGNKIYNGADDNASGTSALLSIAEQLTKTPLMHNVILIFTDAEESGLKGSKAFIKENKELIGHIKLNINMDMLAGSINSHNLHYISRGLDTLLSHESFEQFKRNHLYQEFSIVKGFRRERHALNKRTQWLLASDHGAFHQNGIPFIYYGVGTHQNYHSHNDEFTNTNHQLLIKSTNAIYQQLLFLDQAI